MRLAAPYPGIQTITILPEPEFSDSEALTAEVSTQRTITGGLYTYVKTKNQRRKLVFALRLDRMKALELKAFIQAYYQSVILITDHNDVKWVGQFGSNPFEFEAMQLNNIQIEFEGEKL